MTAAISAWGELTKASLGLVQTGIRTNEMMMASSTVIGSRVGSIAAAARDPWSGDYAELGRLVPEKVSAFSEAANAVVRHWSAFLPETIAYVHHVSYFFSEGRSLSITEMCRFASRTTAYATSVLTNGLNTGSVALAPVHKQATANARRLSSLS